MGKIKGIESDVADSSTSITGPGMDISFKIFEEIRVLIETWYIRCAGCGNALQHSVRHLNGVLDGHFVYDIAIKVCKTVAHKSCTSL